MAASSVEPCALYDTILAFESSWSEWSDITGLERRVNKDLTIVHYWLENLLVLFYTCCFPKHWGQKKQH